MADYKDLLVTLRSKQAALSAELDAVQKAILALEKLLHFTALQTGIVVPTPPPVGVNEFHGMTMPQAIQRFLSRVNEPQTTKQIKTAIVAGGMKGGTNIGSHIYNTLHRLSQPNGSIKRETDGRWSLRPVPRSPMDFDEVPKPD